MSVYKSEKTYTQVIQRFNTQWRQAKSKEATLREMKDFCQTFYSDLMKKFDVNVSFEVLKGLFMTSDSQACLSVDVVRGAVEFIAIAGADFALEGDNNFDMICRKFYERMSKKQNWYGYHNLHHMFRGRIAEKSHFDCENITVVDVLRQLLLRNCVKIRHQKVKRNSNIKALADGFISHINSLGPDRPINRNDLEVEYGRFVQKTPSDVVSVPFKTIVDYLKERKVIKFSSGAAIITYSKQKRLATDQHFVKWQQKEDGYSTGQDQTKGSASATKENDQRKTINKQHASKLAEDCHGVRIISERDSDEIGRSGVIDFGSNIEGMKAMARLTVSFTAHADGKQNLRLKSCKLIDNSNNVFTIGDRYNIHQGKKELDIPSGTSYNFTLYYKSNNIGKHTCPIEFRFMLGNGDVEFSIYRFIEGETKSQEMDELRSTNPYKPLKPRQITRDPHVEIVHGQPPAGMSNLPTKVGLQEYAIPRNIRFGINSGGENFSTALKEILEEGTYGPEAFQKRFHSLLHLEELQMEVDIRRYDMKGAEMNRTANLLSLEVPGLAEGRPSLVIGDRVYVCVQPIDGQQLPQQHARKEYQGYIHVVERDRILLKFSESFHSNFVNGQRHDVRFSFNRTPIRLQHRAIDLGFNAVKAAGFASLINAPAVFAAPLLPEAEVNRIRCCDRKIESNPEQLTAVKNIVAGLSRPFPYIIFGPPGTGKTVTSVEAMKQVLKLFHKSRILACAPSNSAADLILHRLIKPCPIPCKQVFRFNAFSRDVASLPDDFNIKDFCKIEHNVFGMPTLEEIESYRVVVCTMTTAGRLVSMGLSDYHFTHVFLDECGQAVEPEALIPLAGLINPRNQFGGQIVLAGDPKQLGPVLQSPIAKEYGLQVSLLERSMDVGTMYKRRELDGQSESLGSDSDEDGNSDILGRLEALECSDESDQDDEADEDDEDDEDDKFIETGEYDNAYITKLINNYRSHPDILMKPNRLFYSNELRAAADEFKVTSLCQWSELPTKGFPIIFHGVEGEDLREGISPSFFNPHEATEVAQYIRKLLEHRSLGVTPDEIGVISPYRKQVSKIRQLLKKDKDKPRISELKVGSVEEFQGQERRIIIISTVRSNREYLKLDSKFRLGFLRNPKRFNVAVTRAQALLIVVGNPFVLAEDYYWKELLEYCIEKGGYKGCTYNKDVVADLSKQFLEMMKLR